MVDTVKISIEESFMQIEQHVNLWGFLYNLTKLPERAVIAGLCSDLHHALKDKESADVNDEDFCDELLYLSSLLPPDCSTPVNVLQFILNHNLQDNFLNTWVALRILLTLPVSVATAERSFSKLKLLKTYLRSSMADERLSSLAILSIENNVASTIMSEAIAQFAMLKARKVLL